MAKEKDSKEQGLGTEAIDPLELSGTQPVVAEPVLSMLLEANVPLRPPIDEVEGEREESNHFLKKIGCGKGQRMGKRKTLTSLLVGALLVSAAVTTVVVLQVALPRAKTTPPVQEASNSTSPQPSSSPTMRPTEISSLELSHVAAGFRHSW